MIKVAIVDSDKELNSILFSRFKSADINPVEQFYSEKEFINALPQLKSQIVLIDITLPCYDLIDFISTTKKLRPDIEIIITSAWVQHDLVYKAICAGASGYVNKFGDENYFISTIKEISKGKAQLSLPIAQLINTNFSPSHFTNIQSQIIKFIASGFSNANVAAAINQSSEVVYEQINCIYKELHRASQ